VATRTKKICLYCRMFETYADGITGWCGYKQEMMMLFEYCRQADKKKWYKESEVKND